MRWSSFRRFMRLSAEGGPYGDVVILKTDAFGTTGTAECQRRLAPLVGYHPPIDLRALRRLPEGTLGRAYARLLDDNGLSPFEISDDLEPEVIARNVFGLRYAVTHDMFHVLTGFDTSLAGEAGVLGFAAAQGYVRAQRWLMPVAAALYALRSPRQVGAIVRNLRAGWRMGRRAGYLLAEPLEDAFDQPVDALRRRFAIEAGP